MSVSIEVWTDGSCPAPNGPGGYAAIIVAIQVGTGEILKERVVVGHEIETTNNRMELMGVIEGLRAFEKPASFVVFSDSQYVVHAFTKGWLARWQKTGWRTAGIKSTDVKNRDLWEILAVEAQRHRIQWAWVKGHSKFAMNERADEIAGQQTMLARQIADEQHLAELAEPLEAGFDRALALD